MKLREESALTGRRLEKQILSERIKNLIILNEKFMISASFQLGET